MNCQKILLSADILKLYIAAIMRTGHDCKYLFPPVVLNIKIMTFWSIPSDFIYLRLPVFSPSAGPRKADSRTDAPSYSWHNLLPECHPLSSSFFFLPDGFLFLPSLYPFIMCWLLLYSFVYTYCTDKSLPGGGSIPRLRHFWPQTKPDSTDARPA